MFAQYKTSILSIGLRFLFYINLILFFHIAL